MPNHKTISSLIELLWGRSRKTRKEVQARWYMNQYSRALQEIIMWRNITSSNLWICKNVFVQFWVGFSLTYFPWQCMPRAYLVHLAVVRLCIGTHTHIAFPRDYAMMRLSMCRIRPEGPLMSARLPYNHRAYTTTITQQQQQQEQTTTSTTWANKKPWI